MKSPSHNTILRLIAVFKLFKATLLIIVAVGALNLLHRDVGKTVEHWVEASGLNPDGRFVTAAIEKASSLSPERIKALGLGSIIYAALFLTEGIGLWLRKRWAEWFTIIVTSSLVPMEIYEIHRHATPVKFAVLVINVAIVCVSHGSYSQAAGRMKIVVPWPPRLFSAVTRRQPPRLFRGNTGFAVSTAYRFSSENRNVRCRTILLTGSVFWPGA
jgi:uncharacterized membrane protein (DUF2068 family)